MHAHLLGATHALGAVVHKERLVRLASGEVQGDAVDFLARLAVSHLFRYHHVVKEGLETKPENLFPLLDRPSVRDDVQAEPHLLELDKRRHAVTIRCHVGKLRIMVGDDTGGDDLVVFLTHHLLHEKVEVVGVIGSPPLDDLAESEECHIGRKGEPFVRHGLHGGTPRKRRKACRVVQGVIQVEKDRLNHTHKKGKKD